MELSAGAAPHAVLRAHAGIAPTCGARVYLDPLARVIGDVVLGDDCSLWPGVVVRGDVNHVRIGPRCNLQDGVIVHVSHAGPHSRRGGYPTLIGNDVTIGHRAVLHACTIGDNCLIGIGAIVLDGAVVQAQAMVGAGAMVAPGKIVGSGELWLGNPARCVRRLSDAEIEGIAYSAAHYVRLKDRYLG